MMPGVPGCRGGTLAATSHVRHHSATSQNRLTVGQAYRKFVQGSLTTIQLGTAEQVESPRAAQVPGDTPHLPMSGRLPVFYHDRGSSVATDAHLVHPLHGNLRKSSCAAGKQVASQHVIRDRPDACSSGSDRRSDDEMAAANQRDRLDIQLVHNLP